MMRWWILPVEPFAPGDVVTCLSGCCDHQSQSYLINSDQTDMIERVAGACLTGWWVQEFLLGETALRVMHSSLLYLVILMIIVLRGIVASTFCIAQATSQGHFIEMRHYLLYSEWEKTSKATQPQASWLRSRCKIALERQARQLRQARYAGAEATIS